MKLFKNFSFRKLLFNKKFSIALSIFVAFIFWLVIIIDQNPEREQTLSNIPIEISTEGTILSEEGLEVVDEITQKASVTVFGPNYIVSSLKDDDIKIVADLSIVEGSGTYNISLSAVRNSSVSGYSFKEIIPSNITVRFDYFDNKDFIVTPIVEGYEKIEGLIYEDPTVTNSDEALLTVKGPRKELSKISKVVAYHNTDKKFDKTTTFVGDIRFYDEENNLLDASKFSYEHKTINISVPVSKTKSIDFKPSFINAPNGYVVSELQKLLKTDTASFTIVGPPEVIDNTNYIEFTPIDVSKISVKNSSNSFTLTPILPNGVRIIDGFDSVEVTFESSKLANTIKTITKFDDEGTLQTGLSVSFPKDTRVEICGVQPYVYNVKSDDLYLSVDLSNYTKGDYLVKAHIKTKSNLVVWQVATCEIRVVIK